MTDHKERRDDRSRRSRSPHRAHSSRSSNVRQRSPTLSSSRRGRTVQLPFNQRLLQKEDLSVYENLFADYLDIQKRLDVNKLARDEIKGRWKSFIKKWNAGELAEGWYDPARLQNTLQHRRPAETPVQAKARSERSPSGDSDDDEYGPLKPGSASSRHPQGPAVPRLQDLQYKRELDADQRQLDAEQRQHDRKQQRKVQTERLDELAPRADPGSIERKREKKQDTTMTNRAFADAQDSGAVEVADADLMGDGGIDEYKAKKHAVERQKNEREIRREEVLRARAAEREERLAVHREKEEKTMATLRALAQQRYG